MKLRFLPGFLSAFLLSAISLIPEAEAKAEGEPAGLVPIDHAVVRFHAPDTGGAHNPHFIYFRVLSFEARLEALSDRHRGSDPAPYRERHVNSALERHLAETLLAELKVDPEPSQTEFDRQLRNARSSLLERIGGEGALESAARAEGMGLRDVLAVLRRQTRASLYLDRMVAPMLDPSDAELETLHRTRRAPFRDLPFRVARLALHRWYVTQRLSSAVQSFYQNARSRLTVTLLAELPTTQDSR